MASAELYCLECGIDISSKNENCLLRTEKSCAIVPLWSDLCSEELVYFMKNSQFWTWCTSTMAKCARNVSTLLKDV